MASRSHPAEFVAVGGAQARLGDLVHVADTTDVVLTEAGQPAAVLLSARRHAELIDLLDDVEDRLSVYESEGQQTICWSTGEVPTYSVRIVTSTPDGITATPDWYGELEDRLPDSWGASVGPDLRGGVSFQLGVVADDVTTAESKATTAIAHALGQDRPEVIEVQIMRWERFLAEIGSGEPAT